MSMFITSQSEIPKAPFYVCCTDSFMSGWGMSEGKNNRLIFPCENEWEATIVMNNAKDRGDMKYITLCTRKPSLKLSNNAYQVKTKEDYSTWYKKDLFRK